MPALTEKIGSREWTTGERPAGAKQGPGRMAGRGLWNNANSVSSLAARCRAGVLLRRSYAGRGCADLSPARSLLWAPR